MHYYSIIAKEGIAVIEIPERGAIKVDKFTGEILRSATENAEPLRAEEVKAALVDGGAVHVANADVYQCTEAYAKAPTAEINLLPGGMLCLKEELLQVN